MKYIKVFISIILILLGSTLLNITIYDELMANIIIKILGALIMLVGVVWGGRAIKRGKLKNVE